jgi:hypothetical protein
MCMVCRSLFVILSFFKCPERRAFPVPYETPVLLQTANYTQCTLEMIIQLLFLHEQFEDTKGVIRYHLRMLPFLLPVKGEANKFYSKFHTIFYFYNVKRKHTNGFLTHDRMSTIIWGHGTLHDKDSFLTRISRTHCGYVTFLARIKCIFCEHRVTCTADTLWK